MVKARFATIVAAAVLLGGLLAYLRDPPWLIGQTTGLRPWQQGQGEPRYRWSSGHASFFVRADAGTIDIPLSTTFDRQDARPMMVTVSVDDAVAARVVLTDASWTHVKAALPPPGGRRVRRIDVRTSITREDNHGVRIGEVAPVPK
jgi:hypothetical protein